MTEKERAYLCALAKAATPKGVQGPSGDMGVMVPLGEPDMEFLKCGSVDGYKLRIGNSHEVLYQTCGKSPEQCIARMVAMLTAEAS